MAAKMHVFTFFLTFLRNFRKFFIKFVNFILNIGLFNGKLAWFFLQSFLKFSSNFQKFVKFVEKICRKFLTDFYANNYFVFFGTM